MCVSGAVYMILQACFRMFEVSFYLIFSFSVFNVIFLFTYRYAENWYNTYYIIMDSTMFYILLDIFDWEADFLLTVLTRISLQWVPFYKQGAAWLTFVSNKLPLQCKTDSKTNLSTRPLEVNWDLTDTVDIAMLKMPLKESSSLKPQYCTHLGSILVVIYLKTFLST